MIRSAAYTLLATQLLACGTNQPTATLQNDLATFLDWFPGHYDNYQQVIQQQSDNIAQHQRNYRRHSIFRRVDLPAFGDTVFYAEQSRDGDLANLYRQRIYVLSLVPERAAIRLRVHVPQNQQRLAGAWHDPQRLKHLTPEQTVVWPGCDVFWQRFGDSFEGRLEKGACQFDSKRFEQRVVLEETLVLTRNYLAFADRGLSLAGEYLFGMQGNDPAHAWRAEILQCTAGARRWRMHDQGDVFRWESLAGSHSVTAVRAFDSNGQQLVLTATLGDDTRTVAAPTDDAVSLDIGRTSITCEPQPTQQFDQLGQIHD